MATALESEIRPLEERLLDPDVRRSASEVDRLLADDFREFGGSGRVFTKETIIASLAAESGVFEYEFTDFTVTILAPGVVLATYTLTNVTAPNDPGRANRSSIWVQREGSWRIVFHQGTRSSGERRLSPGRRRRRASGRSPWTRPSTPLRSKVPSERHFWPNETCGPVKGKAVAPASCTEGAPKQNLALCRHPSLSP